MEIRYWFTCDCTTQAVQSGIDGVYGAKLSDYYPAGDVQVSVVPATLGGQTHYLSVKFNNGLTALPGGQIRIAAHFNKSDSSPMIQGNDYSYSASWGFTSNPDVTLYQNGQLVWGQEPGGGSTSLLASSKAVAGRIDATGGTPTPTATVEPEGPRVQAAPNISRNGQPIRFRVKAAQGGRVQLSLFDLSGELVYQTSALEGPGTGTLEWAARNQAGSRVASGIYVFVIQVEDGAGSFTQTGKVAVLQ